MYLEHKGQSFRNAKTGCSAFSSVCHCSSAAQAGCGKCGQVVWCAGKWCGVWASGVVCGQVVWCADTVV
ncbi:hypothetical protein BDU57DRAFT_512594 [Ampelomyces quisqualis]|uniref:Uncharacterized protein n=1 Tax=Ampelomyces quisqualis TaxID=50730 RepID=A0A6A5QVM5_AMPQU|nr:hypothetical protein BDU57DRAFT_512594 [Ampelomyces quisqualis]